MWDLAEDEHSIKLIESFIAAGKPIGIVCHSTGALRHVRTPDGKIVTCMDPRLSRWRSIVSIAALAGASMLTSLTARSEEAKSVAPDASLIAKGEYLARAGDCIACHTAPEGRFFAGGLTMPTPFGTLYTSNVTPDR